MRYLIVLLMGMHSVLAISQVGINTEFIENDALFQIDGLKNNPQVATTTSLNDDVVVTLKNGSINLGLGGVAHESAQIDLKANNKSLSLNKVNLSNRTDKVSIPNPRKGTIVYNTNHNATNKVYQGLNYFDGVNWNKVLGNEKALVNELYWYPGTATTIPKMENSIITLGSDYRHGLKIVVVDKNNNKPYSSREVGSYGYRMQFTGRVTRNTGNHKSVRVIVYTGLKSGLVTSASYVVPIYNNQISLSSVSIGVQNSTSSTNFEIDYYVAIATEEYPGLDIELIGYPGANDYRRTTMTLWKLKE